MATVVGKVKSAADALTDKIDSLIDRAAESMTAAEFRKSQAQARRVVRSARARVARARAARRARA